MPGQRDRIRQRRGTGADHETIHGQAGCLVGRHYSQALIGREGCGFAGGAEDIEPITAIGEKKARERGRAYAIRRAPRPDGGCNRGDYAFELGALLAGHRTPQPLTLNAASAAMLASWVSLAESGTIWTGRSRPTRIGPIRVAPPSTSRSLVEIEAEWKVGMISTLAGPDRRQNG